MHKQSGICASGPSLNEATVAEGLEGDSPGGGAPKRRRVERKILKEKGTGVYAVVEPEEEWEDGSELDHLKQFTIPKMQKSKKGIASRIIVQTFIVKLC